MEKVRLGKVCKIQGGYAFKSNQFQKNNIPIIRIGNIQENKVLIDNNICYTKAFLNNHPEFEIKNGDLLIAMSGATVGKVGIYSSKESALLNQRVGKFVITDKIECRYLYFLLISPLFEKFILNNAFGCAQPNISNSKIEEFEFYICSIETQIEIANKLEKVQKIIDLRKKQLEELEELIKSQFVEMFGDIKNDDFDNSQIKDLVDTNIIKTKKKFKKNDVIKYIDISSINNIRNEIIGFTEYKIGEEPSRAQQCLVKGDILISTVRPNLKNIAVNYYNDENIIGSSGFCVLRPNKCELEYLLSVVKSEKFTNDMVAKTTGANYPAIHYTDILNYEIAVPPIELQNQFADIVKQIDKQKFEIEKSLKETEELQKSLMYRYFGG